MFKNLLEGLPGPQLDRQPHPAISVSVGLNHHYVSPIPRPSHMMCAGCNKTTIFETIAKGGHAKAHSLNLLVQVIYSYGIRCKSDFVFYEYEPQHAGVQFEVP